MWFYHIFGCEWYNYPKRQRAMLLFMAGPRVRDLFRQLPGTGANDDFGTALVKRNEYFEPQVSRFYEVYEFRQAKPCGQDASFSDSDYIYSINKKAVKNPTVDVKVCGTSFQVTIDASEFHDLDFEIPIQLVLHGSSSQLCKHALRDNTVTLKNMLLLGRQEELSHFQAAKIEGKDTEDKLRSEEVHHFTTCSSQNVDEKMF